jgi:hypothetical protein
MSNPYYERVLTITPNTVARSAALVTEFDVIEAAFDNLNTAVIAPLLTRFDFTDNELTLTGNVDLTGATAVKVPTVSVTDPDQTKAVNLAAAAAMIGTSGTLIPPYALHAGKSLLSYGTHYDWGYVVPAPAGNGLKVARVNAAGTAYELASFSGGLGNGGVATHSGFSTADQRTILDVTNSTAGTLVALPDATTLPVGTSYVLSSRSGTNTVGVQDASGNLVLIGNSSNGSALVLTDNTTAAGTWKILSSTLTLSDPVTTFRQVRAGFTNVSTVTSHNIKFLLHIGGDDFLLAAGESSGHAVRLRWLRATGLMITEVANVTLSAAGTAVNRIEILRTASDSYVLIRRCTGSNLTHATAVTLSGSTITAGSTVDIQSTTNTNPATAGQYGLAWSAAVNGDKVLVLSQQTGAPGLSMIAFSVSGTTITLGTKVDIRASGGNYSYSSVAACVEADKWIVAYGTDSAPAGIYTFIATASGLTLTANTEQLIHSTCGVAAVAVASSTKAWITYLVKSTTTLQVVPIDITGTAVAVGAPVAVTGGLSSSSATDLGADIELFPDNKIFVRGFSGLTTNGGIAAVGSVASGAYVQSTNTGTGVATYNGYVPVNRLGDLGMAFALGIDSNVYLFSPLGVTQTMSAFVQILHQLGANAKNAAAILLPSNRIVCANEATSATVQVIAAKIGGF